MFRCFLCLAAVLALAAPPAGAGQLHRIRYNNPGLVVDLGAGLWAWPLPMDYDGDGDMDLVISTGGKAYQGTYFFENPSPRGSHVKMPVFKPGVRIAPHRSNVRISYTGGGFRITTPGKRYRAFRTEHFGRPVPIPVAAGFLFPKTRHVRANEWSYADYNGDGKLDLIIGIGDWTEYGWDNAFNSRGEWTHGPLHGYVYVALNRGTDRKPDYARPRPLMAGGQPVDVFGMPSPNFADFDGDGDLDLICGEFLDKFTYFENDGTRTAPHYRAGRRLRHRGQPLAMDLEMIVPVAVDWDHDGDPDLIVGQEDGRVAFLENTGKTVDGVPDFLPPRYFRQQADEVKFGVLATPVSFDWDGDGDEDLLCGDSAGYIGWIENLDGGNPPQWAAPRYLRAGGKVIRIQAGPNGSIQGPCEAKWGYTTFSVADWDLDGRPDLVVNSIWGKILWFRNVGTRHHPRLAPAQPVRVAGRGRPPKPAWNWWQPADHELVTQWRTRPVVTDWNHDGLPDLLMLDPEGYLVLYPRIRRHGKLELRPGRRIFRAAGASVFDSSNRVLVPSGGRLRLNGREAGHSGRRKFCLTDWDGDGRVDLLVNSRNVDFFRNLGEKGGVTTFQDEGPLTRQVLAGHSTSPTTVDWDRNGIRDLLVGVEDGYLYYGRRQELPPPLRHRR